MGLFDFGGGDGGGFAGGQFGGGLDIDQLLQMINPMPPAQAAPLPDGSNPGNVTMDPSKLLNSPAAAEGIREQAAREQAAGSLIGPNVGNPNPTPPGAVAGIPLPQPRPTLERGQPTQVNLGDGGPVPSATVPPVPATAPQLAAAEPPPIRVAPPAGEITPADEAQSAEDKAKLGGTTDMAAKKPTVGGALTGEDEEKAAPETATVATAPKAEETTDFSSKNKDSINTLAKALRGVQAPAAPAVQRISSPNAPRPASAIKGGELQALLMALNAMGGGPQRTLGK